MSKQRDELHRLNVVATSALQNVKDIEIAADCVAQGLNRFRRACPDEPAILQTFDMLLAVLEGFKWRAKNSAEVAAAIAGAAEQIAARGEMP